EHINAYKRGKKTSIDKTLDDVITKFVEIWEVKSGIKTFRKAVADRMEFRAQEGTEFDMTVEQW
ncbi:MAG: hypothetical protein GTN99_00180, partial [Candidatus Dadabacteria bacterium]|nr:hypothetical protein [Candidatus Dadabacteria bacterium]